MCCCCSAFVATAPAASCNGEENQSSNKARDEVQKEANKESVLNVSDTTGNSCTQC
jgi:hypothetical protein